MTLGSIDVAPQKYLPELAKMALVRDGEGAGGDTIHHHCSDVNID